MKKTVKAILLVLAGIVLFWGAVQLLPVKDAVADNPFLMEKGQRPLVIAHGGAKDLFPENTMVAFDGAMALGVDMLELDVRLTKDDVLIAQHDSTIDAVSDGSGKVRDYTYDELTEFNFGYRFTAPDGSRPYENEHVAVTRLGDIFAKYPDMLYNVEIKDTGETGKRAAEVLYSLIQEYGLEDRILVPSFDDGTINYFRSISDGSVMTSSATDETKKFIYCHLAQVDNLINDIKYGAMQLPLSQSGVNLATKSIVNDAHRRNIAVHYWTVDDSETMKKLIEMGVDGIITDRPDIMKEVLEEMGY